jgi:hypothetical protein
LLLANLLTFLLHYCPGNLTALLGLQNSPRTCASTFRWYQGDVRHGWSGEDRRFSGVKPFLNSKRWGKLLSFAHCVYGALRWAKWDEC